MEELHISMTAVAVAVVANFFFGFIWYTVLFGKAWAKEMGFDTNEKPNSGAMIKGMIFMLIGNFLMAFVFAHNIAAWSFVPGTKELGAAGNILNASVFTWLGFYVPTDLGQVAWERRSWKFFSINTVYHLLMLVIAAVILYYMG
jgi:Protein of unknown function (DUF1761)